MFHLISKHFVSTKYIKFVKRLVIRAHTVVGIRIRDLLPHAYLPHHHTYTAIVIKMEILSF